MKKIYLVGGGGHCVSCIDVIESTGQYQILGVIDNDIDKVNTKILNYPIVGTDKELSKFVSDDVEFLVTIGQIKSFEIRKNVTNLILSLGGRLATVISSRAYVSQHALVKEGSIVMHDALINAGAVVGKNCIVNTKSLIEHEAQIGDYCHLSTGSIVNGQVIIEDGVFVGSQSVLLQNIKVPKNTIISAGSFYRG